MHENKKTTAFLRALAYFLCFCILLGNGAFRVSSENACDSAGAAEELYRGLTEERRVIILRRFHISPEQLSQIYSRLFYTYPELFFVSCDYTFTKNQAEVLLFYPVYRMTGEERREAEREFHAAIDGYLAQVPPEVSELRVAEILHDEICRRLTYDGDYQIFDAYGAVKEGKATCQGYTLLYAVLLTECGLKNSFAVSAEMEHIWNTVCIGERWYHIDLTWDDCEYDEIEGEIPRTYFMLCDRELSCLRSYLWQSDFTCDTPFESLPTESDDIVRTVDFEGEKGIAADETTDEKTDEERTSSDNFGDSIWQDFFGKNDFFVIWWEGFDENDP